MLLLTGCAEKTRLEPIKVSKERLEGEPYPKVPDGRIACAHDPKKQCLDDTQTGGLIDDLIGVVDKLNAKLQWLRDYSGALPD